MFAKLLRFWPIVALAVMTLIALVRAWLDARKPRQRTRPAWAYRPRDAGTVQALVQALDRHDGERPASAKAAAMAGTWAAAAAAAAAVGVTHDEDDDGPDIGFLDDAFQPGLRLGLHAGFRNWMDEDDWIGTCADPHAHGLDDGLCGHGSSFDPLALSQFQSDPIDACSSHGIGDDDWMTGGCDPGTSASGFSDDSALVDSAFGDISGVGSHSMFDDISGIGSHSMFDD